MKKIIILFCALTFSIGCFSQKIEIIKLDKGFKELDFTKPKFNAKPDPVPEQNGVYKFTHYLGVVCNDETTGDRGELYQYLNISNGMVGIFDEDIKKMMPGETQNEDGKMDFWAILPSKNQRMYINSKESGKMVMQMSDGDGMSTTTSARFDAWNEGEIFWRNAKKTKTVTLPAHLIEGNKTPIELEVYDFMSQEEGKVQVAMKDLGPAEGQYAPLKKIYAAVGLGGIGYILSPLNNHVYLVFHVATYENTKGCRLFSLKPQNKSFSGAGYKPMGDMILEKLAEGQAEQQQAQAEKEEEINNEEDAQLRDLYKQQAKIEQEIQKKMTDGIVNAGLLNDINELSRMSGIINEDDQYRMLEVGLNIEYRKNQIRLEQEGLSSEERREINKNMNCINKQKTHWSNYRNDVKTLKQKYKTLGQSEIMQKATILMADYQQKMVTLCE